MPGAGDAAKFGHDAGADVQDVGGTLGHVAAQVVQHFGDGRTGFPDGPLCRRAGVDELARGFQEHGVFGHEAVASRTALPSPEALSARPLSSSWTACAAAFKPATASSGLTSAANRSPDGGSLTGLGIWRTEPMMRPGLTPLLLGNSALNPLFLLVGSGPPATAPGARKLAYKIPL